MPTWEWTLPNGKKAQGTGKDEREAWSVYLRNQELIEPPAPGSEEEKGLPKKSGDATDVFEGVLQGLIDPIEGLGQLAEHITGLKAPESIRKRLKDFRTKVQSTVGGEIGEIGGNIAGAFIPGMAGTRLLRGAGMLAPTARLSANTLAARAAAGAAMSAAQPVESGDDYWRTKANQALTGAALGGSLSSIASRAAGIRAPTGPFHWHELVHPKQAIALRAAGPAGRLASRLPAGAIPAAVGDVEGQDTGSE
jgi:hypothetical protein